mmetsp:Transcript_4331/g.10334  ORF Transcript_4331/g.10334 Transcript_4331/m.10334 type:complete len:224 (-) Transcript_4331:179-850(-)
MGVNKPFHEIQIPTHHSTVKWEHCLLLDIRKRTAQIDVALRMNENCIVVLALQQSHTECVADPIARFADSNRVRRSVLFAVEVRLWYHSYTPTARAIDAHLHATIHAVGQRRTILDRAACTSWFTGYLLWRTVCFPKFSCICLCCKRKTQTLAFVLINGKRNAGDPARGWHTVVNREFVKYSFANRFIRKVTDIKGRNTRTTRRTNNHLSRLYKRGARRQRDV